MIARIWKGETPESKADQYFDFLKVTGIKDYRDTKGNQGVLVLRRIGEGRAEFLLLTLWDSWDAIRQFAGARLCTILLSNKQHEQAEKA